MRFLVGVHFRRHFGGPGHLTVAPGALTLADRKETRTVVQTSGPVRVEKKRFEMPGTNYWLELTDGTTTAWATMSRKRADAVLAAVAEAGFGVERA